MVMTMKISDKGFSLLEVIIAMAIFAIGAGGLYGMQITSAQGNTKANQQTGAVAAGTRFAELLMKSSFTSKRLEFSPLPLHNADSSKDNRSSNTNDPEVFALWTAVKRDAPYVTDIKWTVNDLGVADPDPNSRGIMQIFLTVTYDRNRTVDFNFLKIQMTDR
jgi:prepilin-type N-terminal cleavage/methylation domain-containing protein